jgi:exoribonuclease-2
LKEALAGRPAPYSDSELEAAALACTTQENAARKVEREMAKRIAALALRGDIGRKFEAIVAGVTPSGTFVRTRRPRVEGLLAQGAQGVDVGDHIQVKLVSTNVQKGYIDFARA